MDDHPYHHYWFFNLQAGFYQLSAEQQQAATTGFCTVLHNAEDTIVEGYLTRGFKADSSFMLWLRDSTPDTASHLLGQLYRTPLGQYLKLTYSYFGMVRASQYSGRAGKPEQVIQSYPSAERLKYFVVYPFTKTHDWHQLSKDQRREIMFEHMNLGVTFPTIRQCLLYSYGVDDYEFVVSYESPSLEEFQDLVMQLRPTAGRPYTLVDTPIHTGLHMPLDTLMETL